MTLLLTQTPLTCSCSRCITDTPTALTSEQKMLILHTHTHTHTHTPTVKHTTPHVGEVALTHIHKHNRLSFVPTYPLASSPRPHKDTVILGHQENARGEKRQWERARNPFESYPETHHVLKNTEFWYCSHVGIGPCHDEQVEKNIKNILSVHTFDRITPTNNNGWLNCWPFQPLNQSSKAKGKPHVRGKPVIMFFWHEQGERRTPEPTWVEWKS